MNPQCVHFPLQPPSKMQNMISSATLKISTVYKTLIARKRWMRSSDPSDSQTISSQNRTVQREKIASWQDRAGYYLDNNPQLQYSPQLSKDNIVINLGFLLIFSLSFSVFNIFQMQWLLVTYCHIKLMFLNLSTFKESG